MSCIKSESTVTAVTILFCGFVIEAMNAATATAQDARPWVEVENIAPPEEPMVFDEAYNGTNCRDCGGTSAEGTITEETPNRMAPYFSGSRINRYFCSIPAVWHSPLHADLFHR